MLRTVSAVLLLVALGGLTACTDDDAAPASPSPAPPAAPATAADPGAVRSGLADLYAGTGAAEGASRAEGECFADALLGRLSPVELRDAGVLDRDLQVIDDVPPLDPETAAAWVDAQLTCTDFYAESARAQKAATKGAVDAQAYAACLRKALTEEQLRAALAQALGGDLAGPAVARLGAAQAGCVAPARGSSASR